MEHNLADPAYQPRTCLMNEVLPGEKYELVISVLKGGAVVRYRVGAVSYTHLDVYKRQPW